MKLFIVLFIISLIFNQYAYGQEGTCESCIPAGQKCKRLVSQGTNFANYDSIGICQDNTVCGPISLTGNVTDEEAWVCRDRVGEGEQCYYEVDRYNDDSMYSGICEYGLLCNSQSKTCLDSRFAAIGESCKKQTDCSFVNATCTNSICTNTNPTCKDDDECTYDSFCDSITDKCTLKVVEGGACTSETTCFGDLICDSNGSKTCKKSGFLKLGAPCQDNSIACDYNEGLFCSYKSDVCEKYIVPNPSGNCSSTKDSCGENAHCYCGDGKCYEIGFTPNDYSEMINPLFECMIENKCSFFGNILSKSSCASKNCGRLFCEYINVGTKGIMSDKCGTSYTCSNSLSKFNFSILSILLILIITFLI